MVLDRFKDLEIVNIVVWTYDGFFIIDDDGTDIPFDKYSESVIYKDFNNEDGYSAEYFKMIDGQEAIRICIID